MEFGERILDVNYDELIALDGIGEQMALSYLEFMRVNREIIEKLINIIQPKIEEKLEVSDNAFKDKTIVLTGTMSISRGVIKKS